MFTIKVDTKSFELKLQQLHNSVINLSPAMRDIASLLEQETQEAFRNEGQEGSKWADLSEKYKKRRIKLGKGSYQILQSSSGSGGLLGSVHSFSNNNSAGVGAGSGKSSVYAAIHHKGGLAGRNQSAKIPSRPYLPLTKDDKLLQSTEKSILRIIENHILSN